MYRMFLGEVFRQNGHLIPSTATSLCDSVNLRFPIFIAQSNPKFGDCDRPNLCHLINCCWLVLFLLRVCEIIFWFYLFGVVVAGCCSMAVVQNHPVNCHIINNCDRLMRTRPVRWRAPSSARIMWRIRCSGRTEGWGGCEDYVSAALKGIKTTVDFIAQQHS